MNGYFRIIFISLFVILSAIQGFAQKEEKAELLSDATFAGLKLRSIGPAFMSGRIADIAIHPENHSLWYIAVGSGGVWKTRNSGTTWTPTFFVYDSLDLVKFGCY